MTPNSSDQDSNDLAALGWIANYPPWFASFWIKHAKCKTPEETSRLLHLLRSIEDGQPAETRRLLPGIDPNLRLATQDEESESLLEWAAGKARHPDCIRALMAAGADINAPGLVLKLLGKTDLLAEVLKAGDSPSRSAECGRALLGACADDPMAVKMLLEAGARTDLTTTFYITNKKRVDKVSALMLAAHAGQLEIVKLLLDAGANVAAVDSAGNTALAWAKISRAKAPAAKIIALLGGDAATKGAATSCLPEPVDFTTRAKSTEFKEVLALAKAMTKATGKSVELSDDSLPGARAFRAPKAESALALLDEIRPKAAALGALAFLSDNLYENDVSYLVLLPTTDYKEAVVAFGTPEGQAIDCDELTAWLTKLEKTQPFVLTHLAPDLLRAKFTTPIKDAAKLAKAIQAICPDVINEPLKKVAAHLEKSRELYLWWD